MADLSLGEQQRRNMSCGGIVAPALREQGATQGLIEASQASLRNRETQLPLRSVVTAG